MQRRSLLASVLAFLAPSTAIASVAAAPAARRIPVTFGEQPYREIAAGERHYEAFFDLTPGQAEALEIWINGDCVWRAP